MKLISFKQPTYNSGSWSCNLRENWWSAVSYYNFHLSFLHQYIQHRPPLL